MDQALIALAAEAVVSGAFGALNTLDAKLAAQAAEQSAAARAASVAALDNALAQAVGAEAKTAVETGTARTVAEEAASVERVEASLTEIGDRIQNCFVAGTPLLTPGGSKPIERFRAGDLLLSRPESDPEGAPEAKKVEEVFVRLARVLELRVRGRSIGTTAEHPFYVRGKGWRPARLLGPGDVLSSHDGQWLAVEGARETGEFVTVYNLRVADFHTYFVGCPEWGFSVWAHNSYIGDDAQGRKMFRNDEEHLLEGELRLADALDIRPVTATDPEFVQYALQAEGGKLLWVQRLGGEVVFVPARVVEDGIAYDLNHTAASRGADVLGAGEAEVYVSRNGRVTIRVLNNQSGHYSPSADTIPLAAAVIRQQGIGVIREVPVRGA